MVNPSFKHFHSENSVGQLLKVLQIIFRNKLTSRKQVENEKLWHKNAMKMKLIPKIDWKGTILLKCINTVRRYVAVSARRYILKLSTKGLPNRDILGWWGLKRHLQSQNFKQNTLYQCFTKWNCQIHSKVLTYFCCSYWDNYD